MVKKLFKHELAYYLRSMLPIYGILLAIAALGRVIQFFEADNSVYNAISAISIITFVVAIIAVFAMTMVFTISRFYRNLFTGEGYLSFALPVTPTQHILTKLSTAVLVFLASIVVSLLAVCVITAGDVLVEIGKAIGYLVDQLPTILARTFHDTTVAQWQANLLLFVIEAILLIIAILVYDMLLFYGCVTVGQMTQKNRILAAVGVYFGYYVFTQIIGTIVLIIAEYLPWDTLADIFNESPILCIHALVIGYTLLNLLVATALFFVSRFIIRRRLNLE